MKRLTLPLMLVLVMLATAENAAADPFVVQAPSGLSLDFEGFGFRFVGDGFDIGHHPMSVGVFFPLLGNPSCDPCAVGQTYDPSFRTPDDTFLGNGLGSVGGTTYSDLAFFGTLNFNATPVVLPPPAGDGLQLQTPFTFSGVIRGVVGDEQVFALSLIGSGRAVRFFDFSNELGLYFAGENRQSFLFENAPGEAPVPEPGTMLLLATGTAMTAAIRRRRRH